MDENKKNFDLDLKPLDNFDFNAVKEKALEKAEENNSSDVDLKPLDNFDFNVAKEKALENAETVEENNGLDIDLKPLDSFDFDAVKEKAVESIEIDDGGNKTDSGVSAKTEENNGTNNDVKTDEGNYYIDRTEKVRDFIANMENNIDVEDIVEDTENIRPEHKGEVYFSTAPRKKTQSENESTPANIKEQSENNENKEKKGRRRSGALTSLAVIFLLGFIVASTAFLSVLGITCLGDILAINRGKQEVVVTVPENTNLDTMLNLLEEHDLIKNKTFCNLFAKFRHMDSNEYLGGVYYMNPSMGLERMLNLAKVAQTDKETVSVSIPEGYTIYQIFQRLESYDICDADRLYDTLKEIEFEQDFAKELTENEGEYQKFEGYFLPGKYEFSEGENPTSIVNKFFDNYAEKYADYSERAKTLDLTMDQVIVIASIIQKEATSSNQMKDISSVIHNRLRSSISYPKLECDATMEYITNSINQDLGKQLAQDYVKYYDTFTCKGLPAGAICNPGHDAIEAALNPNQTAYYYFLHDDSGNIYFAKTFAEYEEKSQEVLIANGAK